MSNNTYGMQKYYVRVFLSGSESTKYITLGPYYSEKAQKMADDYLSTGICSWIEKVEK